MTLHTEMVRNAAAPKTLVSTAVAVGALLLAACTPSAGTSAAEPSARHPLAPAASRATAAPHPPAHVVVVVEENHSYRDIIGNHDAPYLNSLARSGASLTRMHAITHPSEPNYLALFSGSTHGLTDDSCPHTFHGGNLAGELIGAKRGFTGYSQGLPRTGYRGCSSGAYARKHDPWVNYRALPKRVNRPLRAFPTRYASLPAVSFVIPDLNHDMHDGTIAAADSWLSHRLGGYARWARSHNSLLVVTWDEDDGSASNHIATIITGAHVKPGRYREHADLYRLLRTLEWFYRLRPVGHSAARTPITNIWRH